MPATTKKQVVAIAPHDRAGTVAILAQVGKAVERTGRDVTERPLRTFADLLVFLDDEPDAAARRKARLDEVAGAGLASHAVIAGSARVCRQCARLPSGTPVAL